MPAGPRDISVRAFLVSHTELKTDVLLHTGAVQYLACGNCVEGILKIFADGFVVEEFTTGHEALSSNNNHVKVSVAWSPFVVVETSPVARSNAKCLAGFRVRLLMPSDSEKLHEFVSVGQDAEEERKQWIRTISEAVSAVTSSLFPPHVISTTPCPHVDATNTRILAGYLLLCEASDCVSLLYCELCSHSHGEASLAVYTDELCEVHVAALQISEHAAVRSRRGVHCNIFGIGKLRFCARTNDETELWVRALINLKTKIVCDAPDPSADELAVIRNAVLQRL